MSRVLSLAACFIFLITVSPSLAGPACSAKYQQTADCVQKCASGWGFPGRVMGMDPWGVVIEKADISVTKDQWIAKACGQQVSSSTAGNLGDNTSSDSLNSTSSIPNYLPSFGSTSPTSPSSSSSSTSTSSTSSPPPPPSSSSEQKPTSSSSSETTTTTPDPPKTTSTTQDPPAPSPTQGNNQGATSQDQQQYLSIHNDLRSKHGAAPLTWSSDLEGKAKEWASNCVFKHSGGSLGPFGENLAAGDGDSYGIADGLGDWAAEQSQYNSGNPQPSHYTQMVWKGSTQIGCVMSICGAHTVLTSSDSNQQKFIVCEYSPAGNVLSNFQANVQ